MTQLKRFVSSCPIDRDVGLLIVRVGIGATMLAFHGYRKITGGTDLWGMIGGSMDVLGITVAPVFWGFMAALSESLGSVLLILGALFRPAAALLAFTMFIAALRHLNLPADDPSAGWQGASHALELMCVYLGLLFAGPGRYAVGAIKRATR